ncbi:MAG: helix-turn-helix transcriptional regulator, partial [Desulfitobacteriaceae bacterium]|nr:helix-turn-helix transcriptional regulator [Desulfitobacteriaceae bacterium]
MALFNVETRQKDFSIIGFSLFSGWLLSFPFGGQVLNTLAANVQIDLSLITLASVVFQFIGLFSGGFIIKDQTAGKKAMFAATIVCFIGSIVFFLPYYYLWHIAIMFCAFFAGLFIAGWGYLFKRYSLPDRRLKTAADVLIFSNILMILVNVIAVNLSAYGGLSLAVLLLLASLYFTLSIETDDDEADVKTVNTDISIIKPFIILCIFIFIITIDSGLMYQVVSPAFQEHKTLASYYWVVPYFAALVILRKYSGCFNMAYVLYVAIIMIGLSFISFMWLDRSAVSYLIVDTLMLGAFGVCDLFWWSILGKFFDYYHNPGKILGIGLSMNILGILAGGIIGNWLSFIQGELYYVPALALIVIFSVMAILPILNIQLTQLFKSHNFLIRFSDMPEDEKGQKENDEQEQEEIQEQEQNLILNDKINKLTERETEVVKLLLRGMTYTATAETLGISENTVKYHV